MIIIPIRNSRNFLFFLLLFCFIFANIGEVKANLDNKIKAMIVAESKKTIFVNPSLALAVADTESSFRPNVVSSAGAIGVMQIMPATASGLYNVKRKELFNPRTNISVGVQFLEHLIKKYDGRIDLALSHYNGGSKVNQNGKLQIIPVTRPYIKKVLNKARIYQSQVLQSPRKKNQNILADAPLVPKNKKHKWKHRRLREVDIWLSMIKS